VYSLFFLVKPAGYFAICPLDIFFFSAYGAWYGIPLFVYVIHQESYKLMFIKRALCFCRVKEFLHNDPRDMLSSLITHIFFYKHSLFSAEAQCAY